jgi:hypothetical protein
MTYHSYTKIIICIYLFILKDYHTSLEWKLESWKNTGKLDSWELIILGNVPIWGWPSGWLGILECAPLKVSGSIPSGANFDG